MKKVLILDDEKDIVMLFDVVLKKIGFQTYPAHDLKQAKTILSETDLDAAILDLNLPDGNGFSIVPMLQKRFENLPITICSAYSNDLPLLEKEYHTKVQRFVSKPMNIQDLREIGEWLKSVI